MIRALGMVVLGFLMMGIIIGVGILVGELLKMVERRLPNRWIDHPALLFTIATALFAAWFLGKVTVQIVDAAIAGGLL